MVFFAVIKCLSAVFTHQLIEILTKAQFQENGIFSVTKHLSTLFAHQLIKINQSVSHQDIWELISFRRPGVLKITAKMGVGFDIYIWKPAYAADR